MKIKEYLKKVKNKLFNKKKENEPVRLEKQEIKTHHKRPNYNYLTILTIISVIIILSISVYIIYQTGSLESTTYYYRLK